jgi:hypothetical protein
LVGDAPLDRAPFDGDPFDSDPFDSDPFDSDPFDSDPFDSDPFDGFCGLDPGLFLGFEAKGLLFSGSAIFAGISCVETACLGALLLGG